VLRALRAVDPAIAADEYEAVDNARNHCSTINGGGGDADTTAKARFSTSDHQVTDAEAKLINEALKGTLCCATTGRRSAGARRGGRVAVYTDLPGVPTVRLGRAGPLLRQP
jgi:hypothetical protein